MTMTTVLPNEVFKLIESGQSPEIIDVRMPAEFEMIHAQGARLVPLDQLDPRAIMEARNGAAGKPLYLICKGGTRGGKACEKFIAAGYTNVVNIEGGTEAWEKAGLPVVRGTRKVISLERQVRIGAGVMVLIAMMLGWLVHPAFHGLAAFVGAGLVFAGITDFCGMGMMLARMPWNRASCTAGSCCSK